MYIEMGLERSDFNNENVFAQEMVGIERCDCASFWALVTARNCLDTPQRCKYT